MSRDSVLIYRSFYEAIGMLSNEDAGIMFKAIAGYAMDDIEPELSGILKGYFALIKPQIDANNQRYENGVKGGRPSVKKPLVSETENQNITDGYENKKPLVSEKSDFKKPKEKEKEKEKEKVKEKVKEKEKENVNAKEKDCKESSDELSHTDNPKHQHGEYKKVLLTDDELSKLYTDFGKERTDQAIEFLDSYIVEKSYKSKSHYLAIRRWVINAVDEQAAKKAKQGNTKTVGNESAYQRDREWAEEMQAMQERGELNGF